MCQSVWLSQKGESEWCKQSPDIQQWAATPSTPLMKRRAKVNIYCLHARLSSQAKDSQILRILRTLDSIIYLNIGLLYARWPEILLHWFKHIAYCPLKINNQLYSGQTLLNAT